MKGQGSREYRGDRHGLPYRKPSWTEIPVHRSPGQAELLVGRLKERDRLSNTSTLAEGLGISYHEEARPHPREYAKAIVERLGTGRAN